MLKHLCTYVILEQSGRGTYFGEADATMDKRVHFAFRQGLAPIVCAGETVEENERGATPDAVRRQAREGLARAVSSQADRLVIAHEPVWAMGPRKATTPDGATRANGITGAALGDQFSAEPAAEIRIQLGGSVMAANAESFFHQPGSDCARAGGGRLKPKEFVQIAAGAWA